MIFVKENIVQLPLINHFSASAALVEVPFLRFAQLVKISGVHSWTVQASYSRRKGAPAFDCSERSNAFWRISAARKAVLERESATKRQRFRLCPRNDNGLSIRRERFSESFGCAAHPAPVQGGRNPRTLYFRMFALLAGQRQSNQCPKIAYLLNTAVAVFEQ